MNDASAPENRAAPDYRFARGNIAAAPLCEARRRGAAAMSSALRRYRTADRLARREQDSMNPGFVRALFVGLPSVWCLLTIGSPARAVVGDAREDRGFAAHLVMVLKREGDRAGFCTGVVVAPRIVLTAAHCVTAIGNMRIYYKDDAGQAVIIEVKAVAVHPGFRADGIAKRIVSVDLALVETQTPLGAGFSAAALDDAGTTAVGEGVLIAGYGVGADGVATSAGVLRSAALRVRAPLSGILLWAEDPNRAGAGACTGDSGGPMLSAEGGKVLAIIAWSSGVGGRRCGANTQGVLVAPQRAWIDSVVERWR
jgi:GNAT superfamily N-acetyltransferase